MRVLWISHTAGLSGAERCLVEAVQGLSAKGIINDVIVPEEGLLIDEIAAYARETMIQPHPMWTNEYTPASTPRRIPGFFWYSYKISGIAKRLAPDVIISNTLTVPCGAFAAKLAGIPHVWYIHEFLEEDHNLSFMFGRKLSLQIVDKLSERVITTSQTVFDRFAGEIPKDKLRVVYCANESLQTTTEEAAPVIKKDANKLYLALIGLKTPSKGQEDALKAVSLLTARNINVHLWLVGKSDGNYEEKLKLTAHRLGVENKVDFVPFTKNTSAYLNAADAVLMASKKEAFGRVTVEAMKHGKAVIASDGGANKELITDGWNGLIYQAEAPASLVEKIEMLYRDKALKSRLGDNAQKWASAKFNLENFSSSLINVIKEVCSAVENRKNSRQIEN